MFAATGSPRTFICGRDRFISEDIRANGETDHIAERVKRQLDSNFEKARTLRPRSRKDFFELDAVDELLRLWISLRIHANHSGPLNSLQSGFIKLLKLSLQSRGYDIDTESNKQDLSRDNFETSGIGLNDWSKSLAPLHTGYGTQGNLKHTLLRKLSILRTMNATDPRDKIYSLLGLFQSPTRDYRVGSHDPALLIIDYAEPLRRVYASLVKSIVVPTRRYEIFSECSGRGKEPLRSWISDWTVDHPATDLGLLHFLCRASLESDASFSFSEDLTVMTVRGIIYDQMRIAYGQRLLPWHCWEIRSFFEYDMMIMNLLHSPPAVRSAFDVFNRVLGVVKEADMQMQALFRMHPSAKCLGAEDRFIQTTRGYSGKLTFSSFDHGDLICILLGWPYPMVSRKIGDHHEIKGNSFVDGIMNGEAMACLDTGECKLQDFELH